MTVQADIANFRIDNHCDIIQLPDAVGLRYYNDCRDILIDRIIDEKEDYFYDEITTGIILGQREYVVPKRGDLDTLGNPIDGLIKTKGISIKFKSTDEYYTKLNPKVLENLDFDIRSYEETVDPFFVMSDDSNFIYPTPTESIDDGMIIYGIMYPKKLALSDEENLPDQHKKAILLGISERYFSSIGLYNEAQIFAQRFEKECNRVARSLSGRISAPKTIETPTGIFNLC